MFTIKNSNQIKNTIMKKIYIQLLMVCAGFFLFISNLSAQQTHLEIPVIQGNDDAEEVTTDMWDPIGTIYLGSSDLELAWDDGTQYDGILFRDVRIPKGATIDSAYVQFVAKAESSDVIDLVVYGDKSADADTISATPLYNISSRTKTSAILNWSPEPWLVEYDALPAQRTPDLKSIISEIISIDGWAAGNKIMIVVTQEGQSAEHRNAYSFDSGEGTPVLHIWFTPPQQQTHLTIPIIQSSDDAEEASAASEWGNEGWIGLTSSDLELIWDDDPQYVGTLFRDVQIPQGVTIDSAYIQFVAKKAASDNIDITIYGVDSANVTAITDVDKNISARAKTQAEVSWSPAPWLAEYDALPAQRTPYLNSIIDEIVAKEGWASGNNLMLVLTGIDQNNKNRNAYSFDSGEGTPVLHIWFTGSGTPTGNKLIQSAEFKYSVYPNPTEGKVYIKNPSSDQFSYKIFNINGKIVESRQNITDSGAEVNMAGLTKGLYFIRLASKEKIETHKIILK